MKMTEEYRRTLDEDKRERAMERELGIKHPIPVEHRFVVITEEDGQQKFIEAQPMPNFMAAVIEAAAGIFIVTLLLAIWHVTV